MYDVSMHCELTLVDHGLDVRMLEQDLEIVNLEAVLRDDFQSARLPNILLLFSDIRCCRLT